MSRTDPSISECEPSTTPPNAPRRRGKPRWRRRLGLALLLLCLATPVAGALLGVRLRNPCPAEGDDRLIRVGPAPEDLALDRHSGPRPRLLVSCGGSDRSPANIWAIDLASHRSRPLPRHDEPDDLIFGPHGLHVGRDDQGRTLLHLISRSPDWSRKAVLVYRVEPDRLVFLAEHTSADHLWAANDVAAYPAGGFYVSNDYGGGGMRALRWVFQRADSTIAHRDVHGHWRTAACGLKFANGLSLDASDSALFVATTQGGAVWRFELDQRWAIQPKEPERVADDLTGADNLTRHRDGRLIVAVHRGVLNLFLHRLSRRFASASAVYAVDPLGKAKPQLLASPDPRWISGVSAAVHYRDRLYLAQVSEPAVGVIELDP